MRISKMKLNNVKNYCNMKRIFRILVFAFIAILFLTSAVWVFLICIGETMSFAYLLGYALAITFGVGLFVLGLFGLCKLGDWAFKKD